MSKNDTAEIKAPSEATLALAAIAKPLIVTGENGVFTLTDKKDFAKLLPEDVTESDVKKVFNALDNAMQGIGLAHGEVSIDYLKKNADVQSTSLVVPLTGRNKLSFTFDRTHESRNPATGETTTGYGNLNVKMAVYGTKPKGELGVIKSHLAALAQKSLAGKK